LKSATFLVFCFGVYLRAVIQIVVDQCVITIQNKIDLKQHWRDSKLVTKATPLDSRVRQIT